VANDTFNWDIVVRLATEGAKNAKGDITGFSTAVDEMARTGKVSEKASEQAAKATIQQGRAAASASGDVKKMETSVISLRYANYDLASSMFTLSAGITAAGVGVVAAFASQESAFTNVERTADSALGNIRDRLTELSTQIPFSFNQLAEIATLGNQLGIAAGDLEAFTTTVAQFSVVTGISAEQASLAFGKLGNLLGVGAADYDRLASSIALVGRTTAATEAQIVSVAGEIAPAAAAAGFTADQVIGLSGALASLKVPPERSRSTILQFFETLNMAVAEGGDKLDNFASVVGVTASELESMVRGGQGEAILERFIGNVSTADTIEITQALDNLGLAGLRTNPTIRALAGNMELLQSSVATGAQGWTENTELQRQMAFVLDDLSSKWQMFLNAAMNAAAAIGSSVGPAIGQLLDVLKNLLIGLAGFASSDFGQMFFRMAGTILTVVAAYASLRGAIALASGSLQAFSLISSALGGAGIISGLRGLASAFTLVRGGAVGAAAGVHLLPPAFGASTVAASRFAGAMRVAGTALMALGRATIILGLLQAATSLVFDFGGSMQWLAGVSTQVVGFIGAQLSKAAIFIARLASSLASVVPGMSQVASTLNKFAVSTSVNAAAGTLTKGFTDWAKSLKTADDGLGDLGGTASGIPFAAYAGGTGDWADKTDDLGKSAGGAAKQVRTLADYANDLQSVFSRAFDIRFSGGSTLDAITSTFIGIREATEESARNIQKLKAEIQGLQSDLDIQQYFLSIAVEYGDSARAAAIQANIAKLQADLADKTANLTDEQSKNSKELTGNSKAAIANRKQMEDLVKQYQEHLVALASSGLSQAELARRSQQLRAEFVQQATQLGYNATEVEKYAVAFDDLTIAINGVPRNITVTANTNPALQALNEFIAQARSSIGSGINVPVTSSFDDSGARKQARAASIQALMQQALLNMSLARNPVDAAKFAAAAQRYSDILNSGNYYTGGFTGTGGKYEPAGVVHKGEYVVPKKDVNQRTGLPYADAMGRLQRGASGPGYAGGGFVRPSGNSMGMGQIASLGPMAYQQFAQLFDTYARTYLDGRVIADSSSNQYAHSTQVGAA
jgi:TP901 family phage tail tape measure protein